MTGNDGTACLSHRLVHTGFALGHAPDGSIAFQPLSGHTLRGPIDRARKGLVAIQTDRTTWVPGNTVRFRAIFRDRRPGGYSIPSGTREIGRDTPSESTGSARWQRTTLDEYGAGQGEMVLHAGDATDATGFYLIAARAGSNDGYDVYSEPIAAPSHPLELITNRFTVVGGETAHFTVRLHQKQAGGQSGETLSYTATFVKSGGGVPPLRTLYDTEPDPPAIHGSVRVDRDGNGAFDIRTPTIEWPQILRVKVESAGVDGVGTENVVFLTPASYLISLLPSRFYTEPGQSVTLLIDALTFPDRQRRPARITLTFAEVHPDRTLGPWRRTPLPNQYKTVSTNEAAETRVLWKPPHAGLFIVTAEAKDELGRRTTSSWYHYVARAPSDTLRGFPGNWLLPRQRAFDAGEKTTLLAATSEAGVDALAIVCPSGELPTATVVRLKGRLTEISLPVDPSTLRATVALATLHDNEYRWSRAVVYYARPADTLHVSVHTNRAHFSMGDAALVSLDVRDAMDRPARAQVGLSVSATPKPYDDFSLYGALYLSSGSTWVEVQQSWMLGKERNGAMETQQMGTIWDPSGGTDPAHFQDAQFPPWLTSRWTSQSAGVTAFWAPNIVTDKNGHAEVSFKWPDVPATYTIRASAISLTSAAGDATALVTVGASPADAAKATTEPAASR